MEHKRIIYFDGECGMCNKFVLFIIKKDKHRFFKFMSLQKAKFTKRQRKFVGESLSTIIYLNDGVLSKKSKAIISIFSNLSFPYKMLILSWIIPYFIRDYLYDYVANNRYKIYGKIQHCELLNNNKEIKDRFL